MERYQPPDTSGSIVKDILIDGYRYNACVLMEKAEPSCNTFINYVVCMTYIQLVQFKGYLEGIAASEYKPGLRGLNIVE